MKRALVLSLICVLGLAFSGLAATLSGSWDTTVSIDPTESDFSAAIDIDTTLTVNYMVGDWTFTSVTVLDETGWIDQDFNVGGVLGAFSITSALDFDPMTPAFGSWKTTAGVSIAGVTFGMDFTLAGGSVALVLSGSGVAGDVTVDVDVTFGNPLVGCDLDWTGVTIDVGFPFCCADINLAVAFDCTGFLSATFTTYGIAVPSLPWVTLDATLVYTIDEKTLTLSPDFDFGVFACFDLYMSVDTEGANLTLGAISIDGIGLSCDIGAVTFTGLSYWGTGTKPGLLKGTGYWEVYQIATNDDACCGPFGFDVAFYFSNIGTKLFDIALIDANMTLQVASQFEFSMGIMVDVENDVFSAWTLGFLVTW